MNEPHQMMVDSCSSQQRKWTNILLLLMKQEHLQRIIFDAEEVEKLAAIDGFCSAVLISNCGEQGVGFSLLMVERDRPSLNPSDHDFEFWNIYRLDTIWSSIVGLWLAKFGSIVIRHEEFDRFFTSSDAASMILARCLGNEEGRGGIEVEIAPSSDVLTTVKRITEAGVAVWKQ